MFLWKPLVLFSVICWTVLLLKSELLYKLACPRVHTHTHTHTISSAFSYVVSSLYACPAHLSLRWIIHYLRKAAKFFAVNVLGRLRGLVGSALDHISLSPEFESRRGHIWRVYHLWFRFITLLAVKHQSSSVNYLLCSAMFRSVVSADADKWLDTFRIVGGCTYFCHMARLGILQNKVPRTTTTTTTTKLAFSSLL